MITKIFGQWEISIDPERTTAFYQSHHLLSDDCHCDYCLNYLQACDQFAPAVYRFFSSLGIDPKKEGEVMEFGQTAEGLHHYIVFYHVSGKIVKKPSSEYEFPDYQAGGASVSFTADLDLLPEHFPLPAVQVILEMDLPWLLD